MRLARMGALASIALTFILECGLFPSTDGLTASTDAAVSDVLEASVGDGGDAGGRFCAQLSPQPKFCDDFDDVALGLWSSTDVTNGSSVTRDNTAAVSAPSSLLTVTPGASLQIARVHLQIPAFTSLRVAYDVRIDVRGTYAEIGYVHVYAPGIESQYYFRASALPTPVRFTSEAYPEGGLQSHDVSLIGAPTFETWTHVMLDLELGASHTATISINGSVVGMQTLEPNLYFTGATDVDVGTGYTDSTSTEFRIRYDNATIDWN